MFTSANGGELPKKEYDIYRDSLLRYCGYSNEIGESFRPLIPKVYVNLSYGIAISYVLAECSSKSYKVYKKPISIDGDSINSGGIIPASKMAGDVFLWQMFASVIIPGFIINRITWSAGKLVNSSKLMRKVPISKWLPTIIGLLAIPIIIKPIDHSVDIIMDKTYRKYIR